MPASAQSSSERRLTAQLSKLDEQLIEDISGFFYDPLGFIRYTFPWGEKGTPLENEEGPDVWQADICNTIRECLLKGGDVQEAIQIAISSGHGIGKTGLLAMLILWFMSTRDMPQVVVTANTSTQLNTKTWRELAKWHKLAINRGWFQWTATKFFHVLHPETWFAAAVPWTEGNSEAFAGTHEKHVLVIFDEGSAIADKIWEVTEGAMTTPGAMWIVFGNPTQNTGRFADCFGRFKHRWITRQIDSRTAKMANRAQIQKWIDDYGEDHDFVRVRVRGVFPRAGNLQFISLELVANAMRRKADDTYKQFAKVLAVDVARHGDDQSVSCRRQANHVWPLRKYRISNLMVLADTIAGEIHEFQPDAVFIDATGMGWGVIDRLRQMNFQNIHAVQVGELPVDEKKYLRKRDELWGRAKDWLEGGGCLPPDPELETDYISPQYGYDNKQRIEIESKKDMKARGLPSPDCADSVNLTFASPVSSLTRKPAASWRDRLGIKKSRGSAQAA